MSQVRKSQVKTRVKNGSTRSLQLKECTGGVYRNLTILEADKEYTITCNTSATYREYWVGVKVPDSTQPQASSTQSQASDNVTITSDDCIAYRKIHIQEKGANPPRLEVAYQSPRNPNAAILTNLSSGPVTVKTTETIEKNETIREKVLQPDQRVAIPFGTSKHCLEHSVTNAGGATLLIDKEGAAKSETVNIVDAPGAASKLELKMEGIREPANTGFLSTLVGWFK